MALARNGYGKRRRDCIKKQLAWMKDYFRKSSRTPVLENFLGLKLTALEEGAAACGMKIAAKHCNIYGTVHGGTPAAVGKVVSRGNKIMRAEGKIYEGGQLLARRTLPITSPAISAPAPSRKKFNQNKVF